MRNNTESKKVEHILEISKESTAFQNNLSKAREFSVGLCSPASGYCNCGGVMLRHVGLQATAGQCLRLPDPGT